MTRYQPCKLIPVDDVVQDGGHDDLFSDEDFDFLSNPTVTLEPPPATVVAYATKTYEVHVCVYACARERVICVGDGPGNGGGRQQGGGPGSGGKNAGEEHVDAKRPHH